MVSERFSAQSAVALVVIVVSAAVVVTRFGWYTALNSAIPLVIALLWLAVLALAPSSSGRRYSS